MSRVKDIRVKVIPSKIANAFIRKHHYSGKVTQASRLHFGAFLDNILHGVMSFGSPLDKRKVLSLVEDTGWNEMVELNRMAFDNYLPMNSESRCIAITIKLLRKNASHIKWILSFADGTQCGDGTIYRASGFALTKIKKNDRLIHFVNVPSDEFVGMVSIYKEKFHSMHPLYFQSGTRSNKLQKQFIRGFMRSQVNEREFVGLLGAEYLDGFQLRYIYLIDKSCKITVPILPFSKIDEMGARMYKGKRLTSKDSVAAADHAEEGGAIPTVGL